VCVRAGFAPDQNTSADLLYSITDAAADMQLFWEAFPAEGGASRTTYMFAYSGEWRHSALLLKQSIHGLTHTCISAPSSVSIYLCPPAVRCPSPITCLLLLLLSPTSSRISWLWLRALRCCPCSSTRRAHDTSAEHARTDLDAPVGNGQLRLGVV
jgi:hypothetical protein